MHWRKVPSKSDGKVFYAVVAALIASVALTAIALVGRLISKFFVLSNLGQAKSRTNDLKFILLGCLDAAKRRGPKKHCGSWFRFPAIWNCLANVPALRFRPCAP
jgi:hypothetical protein